MRGTVGATQRLPRVLGKRLAKDLMFTGRRLTAAEARAAGFVSRVVAVADLEHELTTIGHAVASASPEAIRYAKQCIDRGVELDPRGCARARADGDRSAARRRTRAWASRELEGADAGRGAPEVGAPEARSPRDAERPLYLSGPSFQSERKRRARMQAMGIGHGDRVGILMGNDEKWLALFYGAALIGAVTVPVNTRFKAAEIDFCLKQSGCKALFYVERFLNIDFGAMVREIGFSERGGCFRRHSQENRFEPASVYAG